MNSRHPTPAAIASANSPLSACQCITPDRYGKKPPMACHALASCVTPEGLLVCHHHKHRYQEDALWYIKDVWIMTGK